MSGAASRATGFPLEFALERSQVFHNHKLANTCSYSQWPQTRSPAWIWRIRAGLHRVDSPLALDVNRGMLCGVTPPVYLPMLAASGAGETARRMGSGTEA